jgi:tetratricopeptide (TPR) repeat protein
MRNRSIVLVVALALVCASACDAFKARMLMKEGNEFYRGERYEEAVGKYQQIVAMEPDDWEANYLIAVSYLAMYHPGSTHPKDVAAADQASKALKKLLELVEQGKAPNQEAADKIHGFYLSILTQANRTDEALAYLEDLHKKKPDDANLMGELATMYAKNNDFPNALRYYKARAEKMPDNKEAWYTIGVACWDRSYHGGMLVSAEEREADVEEGLQAMDKALALDPNYFEALSFTNLLWREKSKVLTLAGKNTDAGMALLKADEYRKKAEDIKAAQVQQDQSQQKGT